MDNSITGRLVGMLCGTAVRYTRRFFFRVLSAGPIPNHVAFILDGNRRFARKWELGEGNGHRAGFLSLMCLMKYCFELGIRYVTIYAFSIDNFNRKPHEVKYVMDLMLEKIQGMLKEESIVNRYGVRVYFIGKLELLEERIRIAAEMAMKATEMNNKIFLLICVCYTSTNEIVHSAEECCRDVWRTEIEQHKPYGTVEETGQKFEGKREEEEKWNGRKEELVEADDRIKLPDIEKNMYMGVAPDVDILVRTSGETRLSNFLSWQTWNGLLYSPEALWPEIGLPHLVWAVLNFQKAFPLFENRKKHY